MNNDVSIKKNTEYYAEHLMKGTGVHLSANHGHSLSADESDFYKALMIGNQKSFKIHEEKLAKKMTKNEIDDELAKNIKSSTLYLNAAYMTLLPQHIASLPAFLSAHPVVENLEIKYFPLTDYKDSQLLKALSTLQLKNLTLSYCNIDSKDVEMIASESKLSQRPSSLDNQIVEFVQNPRELLNQSKQVEEEKLKLAQDELQKKQRMESFRKMQDVLKNQQELMKQRESKDKELKQQVDEISKKQQQESLRQKNLEEQIKQQEKQRQQDLVKQKELQDEIKQQERRNQQEQIKQQKQQELQKQLDSIKKIEEEEKLKQQAKKNQIDLIKKNAPAICRQTAIKIENYVIERKPFKHKLFSGKTFVTHDKKSIVLPKRMCKLLDPIKSAHLAEEKKKNDENLWPNTLNKVIVLGRDADKESKGDEKRRAFYSYFKPGQENKLGFCTEFDMNKNDLKDLEETGVITAFKNNVI